MTPPLRSRLGCLMSTASLLVVGTLATTSPSAVATPAKVTLRGWGSTPTSVAAGGKLVVSPRVLQGSRPGARRAVVLQVRSPGGWRTVARTTSNAGGRARLRWTVPSDAAGPTGTAGLVVRARSGSVRTASRTVRVTATAASTGPATDPGPLDAFRAEVVSLTNAARSQARSCGDQRYPAAGAVSRNAALDLAAQRYADKMSTEHFFDHVGPDGSTMASRIGAAGYTGWRAVGENIAVGQQTPREVVDAWVASPGHCANLMNAALTEMGVGYAPASAHWVQELGRR